MMPSAKKSSVKAVVRALKLPTTMADVKAALTRKLTRATASPSTRGAIKRSTLRTAGLRQSSSGRNCAPSPRRPGSCTSRCSSALSTAPQARPWTLAFPTWAAPATAGSAGAISSAPIIRPMLFMLMAIDGSRKR